MLIRYFTLILICIFSSGCSLYRSEAREFLEKQAFEYAGVAAQANLLGCPVDIENADWTLASETEEARVYLNDEGMYEMQVISNKGDTTFKCMFRFSSAQEMVEKTEDAVDLTLYYMGQSLAQFAFHPISLVK